MECSRSSGGETDEMDLKLIVQTKQRAVIGVYLCLLVVSAAPASQPVLEDTEPTSDFVASEQALAMLHFLRSVVAYNRMKFSPPEDLSLIGTEQTKIKRGFGIAGLDNVDMITSVLDRSRSRARSRPTMSASVNLNQLRALMAKAG